MFLPAEHDDEAIRLIADKVFPYVDEHESLDDEYMAYNIEKKEYPFTLDDFRDLTTYIWDKAGGFDNSDKYAVEGAYFETYHVPYEYNGKNYVLNIMFGQGSAWTLMTESRHNVYKEEIRKLDESVDDDEVSPVF